MLSWRHSAGTPPTPGNEFVAWVKAISSVSHPHVALCEPTWPGNEFVAWVKAISSVSHPHVALCEPTWPGGKALRLVSRGTSVRFRF